MCFVSVGSGERDRIVSALNQNISEIMLGLSWLNLDMWSPQVEQISLPGPIENSEEVSVPVD